MSFTGITVLPLLEMRDWVFCLRPHLTAEKKIAPSAGTTLVPETSPGTSDSSTACSVFFPSWTREQFHVSTALWFKEEQVCSSKQVDVCFIPIIYHLMVKTQVLFTEYPLSYLRFKSTTKLYNSYPHTQRTAITSWEGTNEQLPQIYSGSHKDKNPVLEISLQLHTTHIKSLLLNLKFPAYSIPSSKLHNT